MNRSTPFTVKCMLCGKEFEYSKSVCSACPFYDRCELFRCPNCGYEFPKESKIIEFFSRLFRRKPRRKMQCPEEI